MRTDKFTFTSFSSGSSGNCYLLGYGKSHILIDAGISIKRLRYELGQMSLSTDSIDAVLITHDHSDHIRSLGSYCTKLSKPVYATRELHNALSHHYLCRGAVSSCARIIPEEGVQIGPFAVKCFTVPHDATQTVGFCIRMDDLTYVHITDAGELTAEALEYCRQADVLTLESNYDEEMLINGPYPPELQERIMSPHGHLSNLQCAKALESINHEGLGKVFLCHLSENNNTPDLAFSQSSPIVGPERLVCLPRTYRSDTFVF